MRRKRSTGTLSSTQTNTTNTKPKKRSRKTTPKKVVCLLTGDTFNCRSGFERDIGELLNAKGLKFDYESTKFRYKHYLPNTKCETCSSTVVYKDRIYTPDFLVNGVWLECKGSFSAQERRKFESIKASYPDLDLRFIFMRNNWLTKAHKSRYSDWAEKWNYPYSIGVNIPDEWF